MKNKYERMTKQEKMACKEKYYNTLKGKEMKVRFFRLNIIGCCGVLFSIFLIVSGALSKELNWATWMMAGLLFFFSVFYLVGSFLLKKKCLNDFAVKNMQDKNIK